MPYFPYNRYPYSNFHDLNLDWILETIQELYRRIISYEGSATPYESNPLMDGVADPGHVDEFARGDHRHPTDTSRASVEALRAVQDSVPGPSNGLPKMDGVAYSGFYDNYSRADHVHPSDTSKLDKTGGEVTGIIKINPRRAFASLNRAGWYRIIEYEASNDMEALGSNSKIFNIYLLKRYTNSNNEVHKIALLNPYNKFTFVEEAAAANTQAFTKIRVTHNTTTHKLYIDVYYDSSLENLVSMHFDFFASTDTDERAQAVSFLSVVASPSGETIIQEYTLAANTNVEEYPVKDPNLDTSSYSFNAYRRGDILMYYFNINLPALAAGTEYKLTTLQDLKVPFARNLIVVGQRDGHYLIQFKTNGDVTVYSTSATSSQYIRGEFTMPANP